MLQVSGFRYFRAVPTVEAHNHNCGSSNVVYIKFGNRRPIRVALGMIMNLGRKLWKGLDLHNWT